MRLQRVGALLEDAVGRIVEDDEDDGDAVMRRRPQCLAGIHRAAVADEGDDRPSGLGKLDADRRRQAPTDAAAA